MIHASEAIKISINSDPSIHSYIEQVDELTRDLNPSEVNLKNVSHEIKLSNATEFSVHYTFDDGDEKVDQVWHYEKFDGAWKLNGIETL